MSRRISRAAAAVPIAAVFATVSLAAGAGATTGANPADEKFRIHLKSRSFLPPQAKEVAAIKSNRGGAAGDQVHFLAQFAEIPDAAAQSKIASRGVKLVAYVTANTYVASSTVGGLGALESIEGLRWAGPLEPADKIAPELARGNIGSWARAGQGRVALTVMGHQDVSTGTLETLAAQLGGQVVDSVPAIPAVTAIFAPGRVNQIAREDAVQYVDVVGLPLGELNDGARPATGAATLNAAPYNLNGNGVTVLVYDSGLVDNAHGDFAGRLIQIDTDATETTRNHSTHVAGTMGGDGSQSNQNDSAGNPNGGTANQWAGMAPAVNIRSFGASGSTDTLYNSPGDINANFTTALTAAGGTDLATMSLGNNVVLNGFPCSQLGDYTGTAILLDNIVRGSINAQQLIYFEAVGNERGGAATCGTTYSTVSSPATAKNTIAVGAVNSNDNSMTGFSSWGPTDDGRLRPDIVGPGCQSNGDNTITSTGFDDTDGDGNLDAGETQNAYVGMCGTSMATPAAAGTMALVVQRWKALYGAAARPLGHTAKAIVIHTATDLGNAGPDYQFGWGNINGQAAVDLVNADASANMITVDQVDNGQTDYYTFNSNGAAPPRVTLVWSDPAATQLAATTLINNLDLRLTDPDGVVVQPFVLDPANPANAATRGNDARNPVEVVAGTTGKAGTWTVSVAGTTVPTGPQQYTLVTPESAAANRPPVANADGPYTTPEGTNVGLNAGASTDPDSDPLTYAWAFDGDGVFDDATGATPTFDRVGQDGAYTVAVKVTDDDGAFDIATSTVNVTNVAPSVLNLASNGPKDELASITVTGTISDPGWLEGLTATINWGDGSPVEPVSGTLENVRPNATLTFSVSHAYGDDSGAGTFTATVCGLDDDTSTCAPIALTITNKAPTATISLAGTVLINGVPTFIAHVGVPVPFTADSYDPGSDDRTTTWDWGDGAPSPDTSTLSLNDPAYNPDPDPSPTVNPRTVTDPEPHAFSDACFYTVTFKAADDDGGSASDTVKVIIAGNAAVERNAGYWQTQYRPRPTAFTEAQRVCYLAIAGFMSKVFDEVRDASTVPKAFDVLAVNGNLGIALQQLDRQLLTAWLNFANGAFDLNELVDTDGVGGPDTMFSTVMATAEAVRLNPASTEAQLYAQRDILERINGT
jgi:subtilisin family serine protease